MLSGLNRLLTQTNNSLSQLRGIAALSNIRPWPTAGDGREAAEVPQVRLVRDDRLRPAVPAPLRFLRFRDWFAEWNEESMGAEGAMGELRKQLAAELAAWSDELGRLCRAGCTGAPSDRAGVDLATGVLLGRYILFPGEGFVFATTLQRPGGLRGGGPAGERLYSSDEAKTTAQRSLSAVAASRGRVVKLARSDGVSHRCINC